MIEITQKTFEYAFSEFKNIIETKTNNTLEDFKTNSFVSENENYKYAVLEQAKNSLLTKTWKKNEIGNGKILKAIKDSIQTSVIYNYKTYNNNLIDWRKKDNFNKLKATKETEKLFFNFFKSKIPDKKAFEELSELGFSYQLIAYLFFIKNHQKYLPISQKKVDLIFSTLKIDLITNHNSSWENYRDYIGIIKQFQHYLKTRFDNIELLDAHSFLWICLHNFQDLNKGTPANKIAKTITVKKKTVLENYRPKKGFDFKSLLEQELEIDYVDRLKKQIEIGNRAEEVVLKSEKDFLSLHLPEKVKEIRSVADKTHLGFDIISYEKNGSQKQIEVKAISRNEDNKSFYLTINELNKSKEYPNYYVYCVTELDSNEPKILRIKHPNFENEDEFLMKPVTYKTIFK